MIEQVLLKFKNVKRLGTNKWACSCPAHEDKSPSLSVSLIGNKVLIHCFRGCNWKAICDAAGIEANDLFFHEKTHKYPKDTYNKNRFRNPITKDKVIASITGTAIKDKTMSIPLYCAPSEAFITNAETVFITEGETDCDAIAMIGGAAVCSHSPGLPPRSDISIIKGKNIIVVTDNDAPGFKNLKNTIDRLSADGFLKVRVLTPEPEFKDIRELIESKQYTSIDQVMSMVAESTIKPKAKSRLNQDDEDGIIALLSVIGINNSPRSSVTVLKTGELISIANLNGSRFASYQYMTEKTLPNGTIKLVPALHDYILSESATTIDNRTIDTRETPLSLFKSKKDGLTLFNLWRGWQVKPEPIKDPHPITGLPDGYHQTFMNLAGLPLEADPPETPSEDADHDDLSDDQMNWQSIELIIEWMAHCIQFPMQRLHFAAFIYSAKEGVGKGIIGDMLLSFYGKASIKLGDNDLFSSFSVIDEGLLFAVVNEINLRPSFGSNPMNRLKVLITEDSLSINKKGLPQYQGDNNCAFYITSNKQDEIKLANESRRFLVHRCPNSSQSLPVEVQKSIKENRGKFLSFLLNHKIKHLKFGVPPPTTSGKELVIQSVKTDPLKEFIMEWLCLDSTPIIFTSSELKQAYNREIDPQSAEKCVSADLCGIAMASLGYRSKMTKIQGKMVRLYRKPVITDDGINTF